MVNYSPSLDATFSALADPTRRAILARLADSEASVGDLAEPFDISLPAISRHLRVLEEAGLLARKREGRVHRCRLEPAAMQVAEEWIARYRSFWEGRLDALERYLSGRTKGKQEETAWPPRTLPPRLKRRSASPGRSRRRPRKSFAPGPNGKR
ncbi:MAG: helix-turn-helix transcriptional regulator [Thermoanaerobaculia bacterium]|nr:helix-turn-helix transcriptional regulator [Thermoanaerobaculia bacterium]